MVEAQLSEAGSLGSGQAFADLSFWRKVAVSGSDALAWLDSLVSADLSDLAPGRARQSLLLSPTGRIRAAFTVVQFGQTVLLLQDPKQPKPVDKLLATYVLSSDVALEDRTESVALFAFPGRPRAPDVPGAIASAPSCLGIGIDLLVPSEGHDSVQASLRNYAHVGNEAVEAWRIRAGLPRFGVDVFEEDLPQEGGLSSAVSFDKGCYLGQEAVAKVQNLGHPRRLVMSLVAHGSVSPGDPVLSDGSEAGEVTSVVRDADGAVVLARVKWEARHGSFGTTRGTQLTPRADRALSGTDVR